MKTVKLVDLAKTIRSKNAGTDRITFDIIFNDKSKYELVKDSKIINKDFIAKLYNIEIKNDEIVKKYKVTSKEFKEAVRVLNIPF